METSGKASYEEWLHLDAPNGHRLCLFLAGLERGASLALRKRSRAFWIRGADAGGQMIPGLPRHGLGGGLGRRCRSDPVALRLGRGGSDRRVRRSSLQAHRDSRRLFRGTRITRWESQPHECLPLRARPSAVTRGAVGGSYKALASRPSRFSDCPLSIAHCPALPAKRVSELCGQVRLPRVNR